MTGQQVYQADRAIGGMPRLGGIGEVVAEELRTCCQVEVRVIVQGHLQRGGSPTAFDRLLASRFGTMAVHLVAEGKFGHMVALNGENIVSIPIAQAVATQKFVPLQGDLVRTALGLDLCLGETRTAIESLAGRG